MVSVIVPIYNVENYLRKCIDSIRKQSYTNIEIVLVDDGSTDSSSKIIDEYAACDKRIIPIHKSNGGLVSARQSGLKASSGEYVLYVDGDDWIVENCVEILLSAISEYSVDLVCCSALIYFKNRMVAQKTSYRIGFYGKDELISEVYPSLVQGLNAGCFSSNAWGKLFKRELLYPHQMSVNPQIIMGEDIAFTKPYISSISSMFILEDCLYCYNCMNVESITHAKKSLSWKGPLMISSLLKERMKNVDYDFGPQIDRYLVHSLFNVAVSQFNSGKSYREISCEIRNHLNRPEIRDSLKKSTFSCWKGRLAKYALLYNLFFVMFLSWKNKFG